MKKLLLLLILLIGISSCSTYVPYPTRKQNLDKHAMHPKDRTEPYPGQVVIKELLEEFEKNKQRKANERN